MKAKCPKQLRCLPKKEYHQYVPHSKIKPHPKNPWQSLENPLTHPNAKAIYDQSVAVRNLYAWRDP
jgi:hypothetical protein